MLELTHLKPWIVDYSYSVGANNVSSSGVGVRAKRGLSRRRIMRAQVSRRLFGLEVLYFEGFIKTKLKDCSQKFIDKYADGEGLVQSGVMRIIDGSYSAVHDIRGAVVSCEIEVFR